MNFLAQVMKRVLVVVPFKSDDWGRRYTLLKIAFFFEQSFLAQNNTFFTFTTVKYLTVVGDVLKTKIYNLDNFSTESGRVVILAYI